MRPHTHTQPKVLLQVAGKPMLDHIIDDLRDAGVDGVTLVVGYLGDRIEEHVRKHHSDLTLNFIEQKDMLGLGHAIAITRDVHKDDEKVLIILGDTIVRADFRSMFAMDSSALAVKEVDDPSRFGTVQLKDNTDEIIGLIEKDPNPPTNLAIVGVYKVDDARMMYDALEHIMERDIKTKGEFQLTDALAVMLEKGHTMRKFEIDEWLDCGKPETLLQTNRRLLDLGGGDVEEYRRKYPSAVIVPPVTIGEDCQIENSVVGPYVSMRHNVKLNNAILRDCTIAKESALEEVNLHDSMIGEFTQVKGVSGALILGDHSVVIRD